MKKKYVILGGLFLALTMLVATTLTATATLNGPFSITPDQQRECAGGPSGPTSPPAMATCNAKLFGHTICCNWAQDQIKDCEDDEGNNCFSRDKYEGTCCYP